MLVPPPAAAKPAPSSVAAWYVVGVCMAAYLLSFVDRQILSLLIGPIKADLGISDTAFGLLSGLAFSIFYATLGIPVAGLSDRVSRPVVIAGGIAVWSLATAACGLAGSFAALFSARIFVGAGEGALTPASQALISDLFTRERLGRAMAIYSLGSFFGAGLAFLAGGAVIAAVSRHGSVVLAGLSLKPWQLCFVIVGLPGLLMALLVLLTVRDPHRARQRGTAGEAVPLSAIFALMIRHARVFIPYLLGFAFTGWGFFCTMAWAPAVMTRTLGFDTAGAGLWLGPIAMLAGGGGAYSAGWLMDFFHHRAGRDDAAFLVGIVCGLGLAVFGSALALIYWLGVPNVGLGLVLLAGLQFFAAFPIAPSGALIQAAVPQAMRARLAAILICCTSLSGAGIGTAVVGLLNDRVFGAGAGVAASLGLVAGLGGALAAATFAWGCAPLRGYAASRAG